VIPASATTDSLQLVGATGPAQGGVLTYPYQVTLNGGSSINVACDDYFNEESIGQSWTVNVYTIGANGVPTGGLFTGFANSTQLYDEAAYLFTELTADPSDSANINFAIWGLFDPNALTANGYTTIGTGNSASWAAQAATWYAGAGDVSALLSTEDFVILTPCTENSNDTVCTDDSYTSRGTPQEFIYDFPAPPSNTPPTTTPEPASFALLGIGLASLALVGSRKSLLQAAVNNQQA
jgi:hypothetical protein